MTEQDMWALFKDGEQVTGADSRTGLIYLAERLGICSLISHEHIELADGYEIRPIQKVKGDAN